LVDSLTVFGTMDNSAASSQGLLMFGIVVRAVDFDIKSRLDDGNINGLEPVELF
jgi:hypothetical protein